MGRDSGLKLRRSGKKKPYYGVQRLRTARNKARRAKKRADRAAFWKLKRESEMERPEKPTQK